MILQTLPVALGPNSARSQTRDPRKAAPTTDNLLPFDERFEVVESFFETLAIHALNHERIGDLAEHAAWQRVVEHRRTAQLLVEQPFPQDLIAPGPGSEDTRTDDPARHEPVIAEHML
jgi:hypothetical protein